MKILTKEEEQAHYNAVLKGGLVGGVLGLGVGTGAVWAATKRYQTFRGLTLPFRVFLVVSSATFASVIAGDRASTSYELARNPERRQHKDRQEQLAEELEREKSGLQRAQKWAADNRYSIVFGSWLASMGVAGAIVSRNRYLSGPQKLVQARMYAQGLTIAVLLASFALEADDATKGRGRWETVKVIDPDDPEHKRIIEKRVHHESYAGQDQWRDMVEAEEKKIKQREKFREEVKEEAHEKKEQAKGSAKERVEKAKDVTKDKTEQVKEAAKETTDKVKKSVQG